ncbi:MAG TPA: MFS transporter [Pseudomonadales bacterium]
MADPEVPPLTTATKLSYGVGQVAEGLKNTAMATFVLFYYNQVLGLSGTLAGLALGIALVFDAITDPLAGSVSDNWNSRLGRRHPFIFASALPLAVAFFLLFFPPAIISGQWALFAWLTVTVVAVRAAMTLFHVPHIALGAELSDDYEERTTVVSVRTFFSTFGSLMVYVLGFGLFFTEARGGQIEPSNYGPFGATIAVLMAVTALWSGWGTRHRIPYLHAPEPASQVSLGEALLRVLRDTGRALQNRTFRWLFSGVLILFVMVGLDSALNLYMFNYFWELSSSQTLVLFLILPIGALIGAPFTRLLHRFINKHTTVVLGTSWFAVCELTPVLLRLADLFPENGSPAVFWILLVVRFLMGVGAIQSTVSFNSMMADIADQHELETHRRQEGIFFGAISFSAKGTSGLGNLVAGVGLDVIDWPRGVDIRTAADVAPETIVNLGILYGPLMGAFALVAIWCLSHYDLTRERHAAIQNELAMRRRARVGEPPGAPPPITPHPVRAHADR